MFAVIYRAAEVSDVCSAWPSLDCYMARPDPRCCCFWRNADACFACVMQRHPMLLPAVATEGTVYVTRVR